MADRLVNREPQIGRLENEIVLPGLDALRRQLLGRQRRPSLRSPGMFSDSTYSQPEPRGASSSSYDWKSPVPIAVAETTADADHRLRDVGAFRGHERLHLAAAPGRS